MPSNKAKITHATTGMTIADTASALVARGIAAGTQLGGFTVHLVAKGELDVPAVVDPDSNTIWIRLGESLEDTVFVMLACLDRLTGGTVVLQEDGQLGVAVGAEDMPVLPAQARPQLHVVR